MGDTVRRLTGTIVRETLPDGILSLADEVILIDVTPETLRQRLREGKIYPPERCETALANFFAPRTFLRYGNSLCEKRCEPATASEFHRHSNASYSQSARATSIWR